MMLLGNILTSCTKYDTPLSVEEGDTTGEGRLNIKRNVLWVNIEGAGGGDLVKNAFPDDGVVKGLLPHSRYAWSGLELEHADDISYAPTEEHAVACASLLTGNMPARHGVLDNTYISEQYYDPNTLESIKEYPGFFTLHSLGFMREEKSDGKRRMQQTWQHILDGFCSVLERDPKVRPDAFGGQLTAETFADVLFSLMLSALMRQDYDPSAVLEIVRRSLY